MRIPAPDVRMCLGGRGQSGHREGNAGQEASLCCPLSFQLGLLRDSRTCAFWSSLIWAGGRESLGAVGVTDPKQRKHWVVLVKERQEVVSLPGESTAGRGKATGGRPQGTRRCLLLVSEGERTNSAGKCFEKPISRGGCRLRALFT